METLTLYQRKITNTKNNAIFYKTFAINNGITFEVIVSQAANTLLQKSSVAYPMDVSVDTSDYFMKMKRYTRSDGTKGKKWVLVLLNVHDITHVEFKKVTLEDVTKKIHQELDKKSNNPESYSDAPLNE